MSEVIERTLEDGRRPGQTMFVDCPAYLDTGGAVRCGLPAGVRSRFTMHSSDGPLESVMIRCPAGHQFNGPIEFLTAENRQKHDTGVVFSASHDIFRGSHGGVDGRGGSAMPDSPAEQQREFSRPNSAPAYYQGQPASLWITAMSPRRKRIAGRERTPSEHGDLDLLPATSKLPA